MKIYAMWQLFENPVLIWFLVGLALLLAELALPGLIMIFFGLGAWISALSVVLFDLSFNGQLIVFILSALLGLLLFRNSLKKHWWQKRHSPNELTDEFMGRVCMVVEPIVPGHAGGKVNFKGTTWKARAHVAIAAGETVRIIGKDSIVLLVEPID